MSPTYLYSKMMTVGQLHISKANVKISRLVSSGVVMTIMQDVEKLDSSSIFIRISTCNLFLMNGWEEIISLPCFRLRAELCVSGQMQHVSFRGNLEGHEKFSLVIFSCLLLAWPGASTPLRRVGQAILGKGSEPCYIYHAISFFFSFEHNIFINSHGCHQSI